MPRMRTIKEAIQHIKETDPDTAFTEHALRGMVNTGQIPHVKAGRKILLDIDRLEGYLSSDSPLSAIEAQRAATQAAEFLTPSIARQINQNRGRAS